MRGGTACVSASQAQNRPDEQNRVVSPPPRAITPGVPTRLSQPSGACRVRGAIGTIGDRSDRCSRRPPASAALPLPGAAQRGRSQAPPVPPTPRHGQCLTGGRSRPSPPLRGASLRQEDGRMTYPLAPWTLHGHAVHTLRLVDRVHARAFVPSALE